MQDVKAKQQIIDKLKSSMNILVAVSANPSVDELSAALGLTLLLNNIDKHATAVFSGTIPPAINFLNPDKTFEANADSLRDFIIALNKEKADHLRYKVEGDVVKIYITPYHTTLSRDDLEFDQGDYNVELVVALGVSNQANLDTALSAHGSILHDATTVAITAGDQRSNLGSIDWHDENASSLCEMLVGLSDALKADTTVLTEPVATAFLTGIVAATARFSNTKTTSKAMTVAAQLMGAGADQQLIASKLQESHALGGAPNANEGDLAEGETSKIHQTPPESTAQPDGTLSINHMVDGTLEDVASKVEQTDHVSATAAAEAALATSRVTVEPVSAQKTPVSQPSLAPAHGAVDMSNPGVQSQSNSVEPEPELGGVFNATSEQAHDDARLADQKDKNKKILTHGGGHTTGDESSSFSAPINATVAKVEQEPASVDIFSEAPASQPVIPQPSPVVPPSLPPEPRIDHSQTLADIDKEVGAHQQAVERDALAAIQAAYGAVPNSSESGPSSVNSNLSPFAIPEPPAPPVGNFADLPPLPPQSEPPEHLGDIFPDQTQSPLNNPQSGSADPAQFHIPGQ